MIGVADKTVALQRILQTGPRSNEQVITALPSFTLPLSATDLNTLAGYDLRIVLPDNPEQLNNDGLRALFSQRAATSVVQVAALWLHQCRTEAGTADAAAWCIRW